MLPKMRTIKEITEIMKKDDPNTKLTARALRYLIISGELPSVKIGAKYLVALEVLEAYLKGELKKPTSEGTIKTETVSIRAVGG